MRRRGAVVRRDVDHGAQRCGIEQEVCERVVRRVAGEQDGQRPERDPQHETRVFHAPLVRRKDGDLDRADTEPVPRPERSPRHARARGAFGPQPAEGHVLETARLDREPDLVAVEHREQAGSVVLMRVREHDEIDAPLPRCEAAAEECEEPPGIGATVHEHDGAAELEEERVALADVERAHAGGGLCGHERARAGDEKHERHDSEGPHSRDARQRQTRPIGKAQRGDADPPPRGEKGECERGDRDGGRHAARHLGARAWERCRELDTAPHHRRHRVGGQAERTCRVRRDGADRGGAHPEREERREERDGDEVREWRDERDAAEGRSDDRDGREARGERRRETLAWDRRKPAEPSRDRALEPEQARGRGDAQLEPDGHRDRGLDGDEHAHRQAERIRADGRSPEREAERCDERHHARPQHARRWTDQKRVRRERRRGRDRDAGRREPAAQRERDGGRDERHVEAGDRKQVRGAAARERVREVASDRTALAEHDPDDDRTLGLGDEPQQDRRERLAQRRERIREERCRRRDDARGGGERERGGDGDPQRPARAVCAHSREEERGGGRQQRRPDRPGGEEHRDAGGDQRRGKEGEREEPRHRTRTRSRSSANTRALTSPRI